MDQAPFDVFLRETTISQSLGVSRTTVREAVQVLVRQGLVTHEMDARSARHMVEEYLAEAEHGIARMLNEREANGTAAVPSGR
jgi:DNA-binding GntR family transcriptional regulator